MLTAEADIRTEHAATYLARLCGHAGKMGTVGRRLGHRRPSHARGGAPPRCGAWTAPGPRGPSAWTGAGGPCGPSRARICLPRACRVRQARAPDRELAGPRRL